MPYIVTHLGHTLSKQAFLFYATALLKGALMHNTKSEKELLLERSVDSIQLRGICSTCDNNMYMRGNSNRFLCTQIINLYKFSLFAKNIVIKYFSEKCKRKKIGFV